MQIVMHCLGLPFNGETPYTQSLGGSETACWAMAREMVKLGHDVTVFTMGEPGEFEGVKYSNVGQITEQAPLGEAFHFHAANAPIDALVIQRHPAAFAIRYNSKLNFMWLHDIASKEHAALVGGSMWQVDGVFTVSEYHRQQVIREYDLPDEVVIATQNGLNLDWFTPPSDGRQEYSLLYSSRPERGLEHLVRPGGIMDRLREARPDIDFKLNICHYVDPPQAQGMGDYYQGIYNAVQQREDCQLLGHLSKRDLYGLMQQSWLHVYPTEFPEVSCITAMETQAAGLPIVTTNRTALPETLKGAGAVLVPLLEGDDTRSAPGVPPGPRVDEEAFTDAIIELAGNPKKWERLATQCRRKAPTYDWAVAAKQWDEVFTRKLKERSLASLSALAWHYLRHDDIGALRHLRAEVEAGQMFPGEDFPQDAAECMDRVFGEWSLPGNAEAYRQHYEEHYTAEYEQEWAPTWGDWRADPRVLSICEMLEPLKPGSRVLDIGAADGSFSHAVAVNMPHLRFICVEPDERNLAQFREKLEELGLENVQVFQGDDFNLPDEAVGCEAVMACEVLEHVPDPHAFLHRLAAHVKGKPLMVLSTPYGPWQYNFLPGRDYGRLHLHHFERQDIRELAGVRPEFRIASVPGSGTNRGLHPVGTYTWRFRWDGEGCMGEIDYARKHLQQAPVGTVSLCMIAKDAEHTIGRAIQSVGDLATEVIVGVDETTTDDTARVAEALGAKVFSIKSPLETGFDVARNLTIEKARCQWVMWLDCDEEVQTPQRLLKYLRPSAVSGYGIPQHHFSVEPLGVQKTDFPCRVFRNGQGMRFFGRVHEHPELAFNDGPGRIVQTMDASITHVAYVTEEVRAARFHRNLPLMQRDRVDYPDRTLGHFLWLRDTGYVAQEALAAGNIEMAGEAFAEGEKCWQRLLDGATIQGSGAAAEGSIGVRLLIDGLQYRSLHMELQGIGFWFSADIHGMRVQGPPAEAGETTFQMRYRCKDTEELTQVLGLLVSSKLEVFKPAEL